MFAGSTNELTQWGRATVQWLREFVDSETPRLGDLSRLGVAELYDAGVRFGTWINHTMQEVLPSGQRLRFESTFKQRAVDSRDAFMRTWSQTFSHSVFWLEILS